MEHVKCVVVGDGAVGKTCMLIVYTTNRFPIEYIPTVFDNYFSIVRVNNIEVKLELWDTAGQEEYDRLRPLSYPNTDIFLLVFGINSQVSFKNIKDKWYPEIAHHCPDTPFFLIATKTDLIHDESEYQKLQAKGQTLVSTEAILELGKKINAVKCMGCSSLRVEGLHDIFKEAIGTVLDKKYKHEKKERKHHCVFV
jgi:small GTP-binding protein